MKIGRFPGADGAERLGVVLGETWGEQRVLDLGAAMAARGGEPFPGTMDALIEAGERGLQTARDAVERAQRDGDERWFRAEPEVPWMLPIRVRNCIAGGRNFAAHREETLEYWKKQGAKLHSEIPMGFIKLASSMVPTRSLVRRPPETEWFDYEVEAAAVIGRACERVSEERALEAVFGYTILNDLSARELQRKEMANQSILLGKNFPGLGPLGPWITTADEVPDPSVLRVELRVNGEVRQQADCRDLIFPFQRMIAHWSRMGLDRGDLVTTGSPEGVAIGRPDPMAFYLNPGDVVHAIVDRVGTLETVIG
jgi:2-keto-4-pentenoate hydratase/2-oxohepta-3-ene-1,7-dioic acid hydratase in catechol pathway